MSKTPSATGEGEVCKEKHLQEEACACFNTASGEGSMSSSCNSSYGSGSLEAGATAGNSAMYDGHRGGNEPQLYPDELENVEQDGATNKKTDNDDEQQACVSLEDYLKLCQDVLDCSNPLNSQGSSHVPNPVMCQEPMWHWEHMGDIPSPSTGSDSSVNAAIIDEEFKDIIADFDSCDERIAREMGARN